MFKKLTLPAVGIALAMGLASNQASALTLNPAEACSVNSVTLFGQAADSCYGIVDQTALDLSTPAVNDKNGNIEESNYATQLADWSSFAGDAWTVVPATFTDGEWSSNAIAGYEELIIVLKQATYWGAWYFSPITDDEGTWTTAWGTFIQQQGGTDVEDNLSHSFALVRGTATEVPEPASLALFGLGLLGVGLARRRKAVS